MKVYDLTSYLNNEKSKIKIGEKEYNIEDGFSSVLKMDALSHRREANQITDSEFVVEFLGIALGNEATDELIQADHKTQFYMKVIECVQETIGGGDKTEGTPSENLV